MTDILTNDAISTDASFIAATNTAVPSQLAVKTYADTKLSSVAVTAPITGNGTGASPLAMAAATTSVPGYLTAADWTTFNGKQAALGFTPINKAGDTGVGALSFSGTIACTSATTGVATGTGGHSASVISTATASGSNAGAWFSIIGNPASTSTANYLGFRGLGQTDSSNTQTLSGIVAGGYFNATHSGSGPLATLRGTNNIATVTSGGGSISSAMYGLYNEATINATSVQTFPLVRGLFTIGTINSPSGATITQWNGMENSFTLNAAAGITTIRGLLLNPISLTNIGSSTTIAQIDIGAINGASTTPAANAYAIRTGNVSGATNNWQLNLGTGISKLNDTTASTSTTTGALTVAGGLGVAGAGNFGGNVMSTQYKLSALNTAPASATATGTLGEIRVTAGYIYVCVAANTWVRSTLSTW